jgi:hypothetical protein
MVYNTQPGKERVPRNRAICQPAQGRQIQEREADRVRAEQKEASM